MLHFWGTSLEIVALYTCVSRFSFWRDDLSFYIEMSAGTSRFFLYLKVRRVKMISTVDFRSSLRVMKITTLVNNEKAANLTWASLGSSSEVRFEKWGMHSSNQTTHKIKVLVELLFRPVESLCSVDVTSFCRIVGACFSQKHPNQ